MSITDEQVAELRRLESEASPGEWRLETYKYVGPNGSEGVMYDVRSDATDGDMGLLVRLERCTAVGHPLEARNGALIAAMRNALPALLAALESARIDAAQERAMREAAERVTDKVRRERDVAVARQHMRERRITDLEADIDRRRGEHAALFDECAALRAEVERLGQKLLTNDDDSAFVQDALNRTIDALRAEVERLRRVVEAARGLEHRWGPIAEALAALDAAEVGR